MNQFFSFFLGTPRRFLATTISLAALAGFAYFNPGVIQGAVIALINELWPLVEVIIVGAVMYLGFRMILKGLSGSSGGNKKSS